MTTHLLLSYTTISCGLSSHWSYRSQLTLTSMTYYSSRKMPFLFLLCILLQTRTRVAYSTSQTWWDEPDQFNNILPAYIFCLDTFDSTICSPKNTEKFPSKDFYKTAAIYIQGFFTRQLLCAWYVMARPTHFPHPTLFC